MTVETERRTFSREEFYDCVWSAPATKLAQELGCSDVMIGKICKSFDIPKPFPGYWAMLANGKSPEKSPLPPNSDPALQTLVFHQHRDYETTVNEPPRELQYDDDIQDMLKLSRQLGTVTVAESLRSPHHLVAVTKEDDERRIKEAKIPFADRNYTSPKSRLKLLAIDVSEKQRHRAYRIFDAFIKRIEAIGGEVKVIVPKHDWAYMDSTVFLGGESVTSIRLREKCNQKRIVNPDAKYSWDRNRTELVPSGLLLFDRGPSDYSSPLAMDGKSKSIEDKLDGLIIDFIRQVGEARIKRRKDLEIAQIHAEQERIRLEREAEIKRREEELKKQKAEEAARVEQLVDHSLAWQRCQLIREYLDALCLCATGNSGKVDVDSELAKYLRWGFQQADRLDPLRPTPHSVLDDEGIVSDPSPESCVDPRKPR